MTKMQEATRAHRAAAQAHREAAEATRRAMSADREGCIDDSAPDHDEHVVAEWTANTSAIAATRLAIDLTSHKGAWLDEIGKSLLVLASAAEDAPCMSEDAIAVSMETASLHDEVADWLERNIS
jgi:hypothetical protein